MNKPILGIIQGDIAGIGPELLCKILNRPHVHKKAHIVIIGAYEAYQRGIETTGIDIPVKAIVSAEQIDFTGSNADTIYHLNLDIAGIGAVPFGETSPQGGKSCLMGLEIALKLQQQGLVQSLCFMPFNKESMHKGGNKFNDEMHFCKHYLKYDGMVSEFNVVDGIWNGRVTSHVSLREVPDMITYDRVSRAIDLAHETLCKAGYKTPRIAVTGLNPHAGDGGLMGMEEIQVIIPAVESAQQRGINVSGPYPGDTVYLHKDDRGKCAFDTVVTMYHDQGQVAIKMMGFDRGVSVMGGLPIPITTPAHGTAFDIAGQNKANDVPTYNAVMMSITMGS